MSAIKKVQEFERLGFVPVNRPDLKPYPMKFPFDWNADPYNDANWRFQLQTLRYLMIYLSAFKETKESKYLSILLAWFKDWWDSVQSCENNEAWHDMAAGIRSEKIHLIAKQLRDSKLKAPKWFNDMLLKHVEVLRREGFIRLYHNHGLYAVHGLRCLAEHLGPGMKRNVVESSHNLFACIIKNQFDQNYVHKEHSPHYHHLVLGSLKEYRKTGLYDHLDVLSEYIEGAQKVSENLYLPDGREIPFGDTDNKPGKNIGQGSNSGQKSLWCKSGYAVYKEGATYLCMTNNYNSRVHKHWDNMSLIFGDSSGDILVDPGKYKYANDPIRQMVISSSLHNTISFEDCSWCGDDIVKGSLLLDASELHDGLFVSSALDVFSQGLKVSLKRGVRYSKDKLSVVDELFGMPFEEKLGKAFSRFNFHKRFFIVESGVDEIILGDGDIQFALTFSARDSDNKGCDVLYDIEAVPISYLYGSYDNSVSVKIFNPCSLEVALEIKK